MKSSPAPQVGRRWRAWRAHHVGPLHHSLNEGRGLAGTGTHSLSSSLPEHPGHGGFIGQAELAPVLRSTER